MNSFDCFASVEAAQQGWLDQKGQLEPKRSLDWLKTQARFGVPVWAVCLDCEHTRLLDAIELLSVVKPSTTELAELEGRLRCRGCRGKSCELRAATPIPEYFA